MRSEICKDRICTDKEGENPRTIFDLQLEPSERADYPEEKEDPQGYERTREGHQARQEADHPADHREEITMPEIGTISKGIMKAAT